MNYSGPHAGATDTVATDGHPGIPEAITRSDSDIRLLGDQQLLDAVADLEDASRELDVAKARYAAEVAHRSRRELGRDSMASKRNQLSGVALLRSVTRTSFQEAARRIRVGTLLAEQAAADELAADGLAADELTADGLAADGLPSTGDVAAAGDRSAADADRGNVDAAPPMWPLAAVVEAVRDGRLGIEGADSVTRTLAPVIAQVEHELLADAAEIIATESSSRNADDLATMARGVRDSLDRLGVVDREAHLRSQRGLKKGRVIDGLRRVTMVLDPETDAIIIGAIDHAMSPRLGGPRFTAPDEVDRARRIVEDDRTNDQLALDVLTDLVRIGVDRDDGTVLGASKPGVRVTIALDDLGTATDDGARPNSGTAPDSRDVDGREDGVAWLEGSTEPVSAATARRILCDSGALPIVLGGRSEPLDVGRTKRLFTAAQRAALAYRDGGCRGTDCDRPPSWCEAHHIDPYEPVRGSDRPGGPTDIDNGLLLCRKHHLDLHNNGWAIRRGQSPGEFFLIPPASVDPERTPLPMPTKRPPWLRRAS